MALIVNVSDGLLYEEYLKLRWILLRRPLGGKRGSEVDQIENTSYHRAIVNNENNVIGVGRIHFADNLAQIRYMAIKKVHSRKGYGTALIDALEKIASNHKIDKVFLNSRINAIKFYQKNGYRKIKRVDSSFGDIIHYRMEKML